MMIAMVPLDETHAPNGIIAVACTKCGYQYELMPA